MHIILFLNNWLKWKTNLKYEYKLKTIKTIYEKRQYDFLFKFIGDIYLQDLKVLMYATKCYVLEF